MPGEKSGQVVRFLHITDCHLGTGAVVRTVDRKMKAAGMDDPSRAEMLKLSLRRLAEDLKHRGEQLDGVLYSGDGTNQGDAEGQKQLRQLLIEELSSVGIDAHNIVATPGNHDVVRGSAPGSTERYALFTQAWQSDPAVVSPYLDGVTLPDGAKHVLKAPDGAWAVFPINTANWCQLALQDQDYEGLAALREKSKGEPVIEKLLETLTTHDIARVSEGQLEFLRNLVTNTGAIPLRIAVLHHHTQSVGTQEEFKSFAEITNLAQLRQVLRELGFKIVVHGHKHHSAVTYDHVYPDNEVGGAGHRLVTISGGTFNETPGANDEPMRLIEVAQIKHAPLCTVTPIRLATSGRNLRKGKPISIRVWEASDDRDAPIVIYGTTVQDVYERAVQVAETKPSRPMICTLELPVDQKLPIPENYPHKGAADMKAWFEETVRWWQLPSSRIAERIPYIHGSRLRRYSGWFDQLEEIVSILKDGKETSKAIAIVTDPIRDLPGKRPFASFCFVHFCLRGDKALDCIGYYRTQEFRHWWPINVAELRHMQVEAAEQASLSPGLITTIAAFPRLSTVRQPTKVAVPLIDQWLDHCPDRIAMIATALMNGNGGADAVQGLAHWRQCLDDLAEGTTEFHADGVPVAIEGLELLKNWMICANAQNEVAQTLEKLIIVNRALPDNPRLEDFRSWKAQATNLLQTLRNATLKAGDP